MKKSKVLISILFCVIFAVTFFLLYKHFKHEQIISPELVMPEAAIPEAVIQESIILLNKQREQIGAQEDGEKFNNILQDAYINIEALRYFDHSKTGANVDLFLPIFKDNTDIIFFESRIYNYFGSIKQNFEGSLYLGYRHLVPENNKLYGVYSSFDFKRVIHNKYFQQITLGIEYWVNKIFFGAKFFIPFGITQNSRVAAVSGVSAESGYELSKQTAIFLEGYFLNTSYHAIVPGVRARIKQKLFDRVAVELGFQTDKISGNQVLLKLNIKIGGKSSQNNSNDGVVSHLLDRISRSDMVFFIENKPVRQYRVLKTYMFNKETGQPLNGPYGKYPGTFEQAKKDKKIISILTVDSDDPDTIFNTISKYGKDEKMECWYDKQELKIGGSSPECPLNYADFQNQQQQGKYEEVITSYEDDLDDILGYTSNAKIKDINEDPTAHQNHFLAGMNFDINLGNFFTIKKKPVTNPRRMNSTFFSV